MAAEQPDPNPLEQLVDLLVYAPVGLLYEYQEVIPKLVKRGKSQVQLARLLARMAASQARPGGPVAPPRIDEVANVAWTVLARAITEIGSNIGLAPPGPSSSRQPPPARTSRPEDVEVPDQALPSPEAPPGDDALPSPEAPPSPDALPAEEALPLLGGAPPPPEGRPVPLRPGATGGVATTASGTGPLPIAGYDALTARDIVGLLGDLSARQRVRVRQHETAHRGRKTILAKLDQLEQLDDGRDRADGRQGRAAPDSRS